MPIIKHDFTNEIVTILNRYFDGKGELILEKSEIIFFRYRQGIKVSHHICCEDQRAKGRNTDGD
jgi:hypothetical protein